MIRPVIAGSGEHVHQQAAEEDPYLLVHLVAAIGDVRANPRAHCGVRAGQVRREIEDPLRFAVQRTISGSILSARAESPIRTGQGADSTTGSTGRCNRSWPDALKREIVAVTFAAGSSVSIVARQYDVNANQVFSWRRRYREEPRPLSALPAPQLIPVMVTAEQDCAATQPSAAAEKIEADVAGKYRVHIGGGLDKQALRRILTLIDAALSA